MRLAQQLYEGVDFGEGAVGLITYMRTDSLNLANEAMQEIRQVIVAKYGQESLPEAPRVYKTKSKNAQEAHEAVRPTSAAITPGAAGRQDRRRSVQALQPDLEARGREPDGARRVRHRRRRPGAGHGAKREGATAVLRANGSTLVKPGYIAVYKEGVDDGGDDDNDRILPPLEVGDGLKLLGHPPRAALHRAAAALLGSEPGQGAGRARHRPPVDLREHHLDAGQQEVHGAAEPPLHADRSRQDRQQVPDAQLPSLRRVRLHRQDGRRPRRDRRRPRSVGAGARALLEGIQGARRHRRRDGHARGRVGSARARQRPDDGQADLGALRQVRPVRADGHEGRRREAEVREPAPAPAHGLAHAAGGAGAVQAAARDRPDCRTATRSASRSAASVRTCSTARRNSSRSRTTIRTPSSCRARWS